MSQAKAQPSNAFSIPSSDSLGYREIVPIAVMQATTCIVQSWIAMFSGPPSEDQITSMIAAVKAELAKPLG